MKDKNGIEIKTGMIVEISGAYFKSDNGLYYVERSPGDPGWLGSDYSLHKISKSGKLSKAKNNLCFWPISVFVCGPKYYEAKRWNADHAVIEVKPVLANMAEVAGHFRDKAAAMAENVMRMAWDFGEDSAVVREHREIMKHYEAVAAAIGA